MNEPALTDFCRFARAHVESGDIDPMYPVLRTAYQRAGISVETALWRTLCYVTWYHVGSASRVWTALPEPPPVEILLTTNKTFPTGTERRGFRGNDLAWKHLAAVMERARKRGGSLSRWLMTLTSAGGKEAWDAVRDEFQAVPYGGNWSSYKWADLLKNVHGYPITASDIGVGGGGETAGPVPGMTRVTGRDWKVCASDVGLQEELLQECVARGVPFSGLDQLETSLCDFNSLCKGSYYVGHDIDDQMEKLDATGLTEMWEARREAFPIAYLGEVGGWFGVRKHLKALYRDKGEIYAAT